MTAGPEVIREVPAILPFLKRPRARTAEIHQPLRMVVQHRPASVSHSASELRDLVKLSDRKPISTDYGYSYAIVRAIDDLE